MATKSTWYLYRNYIALGGGAQIVSGILRGQNLLKPAHIHQQRQPVIKTTGEWRGRCSQLPSAKKGIYMPAEMKPCPFCGMSLVFQLNGWWAHPANYGCVCPVDGLRVDNNLISIEAWNRRADIRECARQQPTTAAAQNTADTVE